MSHSFLLSIDSILEDEGYYLQVDAHVSADIQSSTTLPYPRPLLICHLIISSYVSCLSNTSQNEPVFPHQRCLLHNALLNHPIFLPIRSCFCSESDQSPSDLILQFRQPVMHSDQFLDLLRRRLVHPIHLLILLFVICIVPFEVQRLLQRYVACQW